MKVGTSKIKNFVPRAASLTVALQFVLSTCIYPAFAESDSAISNNTLPMPTPSSSGLVNKVWSDINQSEPAAVSKDDPRLNVFIRPEASPTAGTAATSATTNTMDTSVGALKPEIKMVAPEAESQVPVTVDTASAPLSEANTTAAVPVAPTAEQPASEQTFIMPAALGSAPSAPTADQPITVAANLTALPPGAVLSRMPVQDGSGPLVVDNDEVEEVKETLKYEELATDEAQSKVKVGARFPVVIISEITSKTSKKGDPVQGRLKYDLKIGNRHVANKGSAVNGHLNYSLKARTIMHSLVSPERWYRNSGCLGFQFDEIINEKGEHLPLKAQPARAARIVKNKGEGRELGVNHYGQITGPWAQQLRYKAIRYGLNAALAPAGVFSFGAMPVALGIIGAANPSFAFSKPVGLNVRHRRLKGFAWGFLSGVPGSWLIEDTTVKGQEAVIKPGDEFYAEFVEEFTGEPATDAQLMPNASAKIHGQVLTDTKKGKKK
ncbi:MAG: hypothetical protein K2W82_07230 [Candidatus Obscuribacterales bacterium]|nr:hypothetical protein [Candidatus Obscuribacterales bacterium]